MPRLAFAFAVLSVASIARGQSCPPLWVRSQTDLGVAIYRMAVLDGIAFTFGPTASTSLDISDPTAPIVLASAPGLSFTSVLDFAILPNFIVVAGDGIGLLDPKQPGVLMPTKVYGDGAFSRVATDGNRLYASQNAGSNGILHVLDMTIPSKPVVLAIYSAPTGIYFNHMASIAPDMLAVAYGGFWPDVVVFDLFDPTILNKAAIAMPSSLSVSVGDATASSGRLYISTDFYGQREFTEFNVSNPVLPKKLSTLYSGVSGDFGIVTLPNFVALTHVGTGFQIDLDVFSRQLGPSKPVGTVNLNNTGMSNIQPKAMEGDRIFVVHNGVLTIVDPMPCPANCDCTNSLDIDDFICFQTRFALNDPYADCDADGELTVDDFVCFQTAYAAGC